MLLSSVFAYSRNGQYKTRTADCGPGIKRGLSLKIAVLTHKSKKKCYFFWFSPARLSWVYFIYSISFSDLKYGFENSENYFRIRQQQGTLNLKEGDKV